MGEAVAGSRALAVHSINYTNSEYFEYRVYISWYNRYVLFSRRRVRTRHGAFFDLISFVCFCLKIPFTAATAATGTAGTGTGGDEQRRQRGVLRAEVVRRLADAQRHGEQHVAFRCG